MSGRTMLYKPPAWRRAETLAAGALAIGIGLVARYAFHVRPPLAALSGLVGIVLVLLVSGWLGAAARCACPPLN